MHPEEDPLQLDLHADGVLSNAFAIIMEYFQRMVLTSGEALLIYPLPMLRHLADSSPYPERCLKFPCAAVV